MSQQHGGPPPGWPAPPTENTFGPGKTQIGEPPPEAAFPVAPEGAFGAGAAAPQAGGVAKTMVDDGSALNAPPAYQAHPAYSPSPYGAVPQASPPMGSYGGPAPTAPYDPYAGAAPFAPPPSPARHARAASGAPLIALGIAVFALIGLGATGFFIWRGRQNAKADESTAATIEIPTVATVPSDPPNATPPAQQNPPPASDSPPEAPAAPAQTTAKAPTPNTTSAKPPSTGTAPKPPVTATVPIPTNTTTAPTPTSTTTPTRKIPLPKFGKK